MAQHEESQHFDDNSLKLHFLIKINLIKLK